MERKRKHRTIAEAACELHVTSWNISICWNHANAGTARIPPSMLGMRLKMNMKCTRMEIFTAVKIHTVIFWVWQCNLVRNIMLNSVPQHNCFITQSSYIGYMFRLLNSHLQAYFNRFSHKMLCTHWDSSVFTSMEYIKLDHFPRKVNDLVLCIPLIICLEI